MNFVTSPGINGFYRIGTGVESDASNGFEGELPETLIIPSNIGNKVVNEVGASAFFRANLKYIYIEEGIETLNVNAFRNIKELKTVNLPSSLKFIHQCCFDDCKELETVNINQPSSLRLVGSSAFSTCEKLTHFILPKTIEKIAALSFCEISSNFTIFYCGYQIFDEPLILKDSPNVKIIVSNPSVHSFAGRETVYGDTICNNRTPRPITQLFFRKPKYHVLFSMLVYVTL